MTPRDKRDHSFFRWNVLRRAQQVSLTLVVVTAILIVVLLIRAVVSPCRDAPLSAQAGRAPLASRLGVARPSPTPLSTPTPTPLRIGIVSGHRGSDCGAVCADGLTEAEVNFDIASRVASALRARGYEVDVLDEFDPRLTNYRALLLLSIHADSCEYINDEATGFKVARVLDSHVPEAEDRLVACLIEHYAARTGLRLHANSITPDMTSYHGFFEIAPDTPAAIIETGFLYLDRPFLTQRPDLAAQGIVEGIICFLTSP